MKTPPGRGFWREWGLVAGVLGGAAVLALGYGVLQAGTRLNTGDWDRTPVSALPRKVLTGQYVFGPWHAAVGLLALGVLTVLGALALVKVLAVRGRSQSARAARHMGSGDVLGRAAAVSKVKDGKLAAEGVAPGVVIARTLAGGTDLWASWRDGMVAIMGPGAGKTTGLVVPLALTVPGSAVITANKRDVPDALVGARMEVGRVWKFDPQKIQDEENGGLPPFYWDPCEDIREAREDGEMEVVAGRIAGDWEHAAKTDPDASTDAFFSGAGRDLVRGLLLAAAIGELPVSRVYEWANDDSDPEPWRILRAANVRSWQKLRKTYELIPDTRDGIFQNALELVPFMGNERAMRWLEKQGPDDARPRFSPRDFVRSVDQTLFVLSKKGAGSFAPITTSLVVSVKHAAEEYAKKLPHNRLPVPLAFLLDEAANTCRDESLPDSYSFYGGMGLFLVTILQNWAQGVRTWGEHGMEAMWSASTICMLGSGQSDSKFLESEAKRIPKQWIPVTSFGSSTGGRGGGGSSTNTSYQEKEVMGVPELAALTPGHCVVSTPGSYPILGRVLPWFSASDRPAAMTASVARSLAWYEPKEKVSS